MIGPALDVVRRRGIIPVQVKGRRANGDDDYLIIIVPVYALDVYGIVVLSRVINNVGAKFYHSTNQARRHVRSKFQRFQLSWLLKPCICNGSFLCIPHLDHPLLRPYSGGLEADIDYNVSCSEPFGCVVRWHKIFLGLRLEGKQKELCELPYEHRRCRE